MPSISEFYGIKIYMYWENNEKHNLPHFHAYYSEYEGTFRLNGDLIIGNIPRTAQKLIKKWAMLNLLKLNYNWNKISKLQAAEKIEGLK